jgi:hypothetical protein
VGKNKTISFKIRNEVRVSTLSIYFLHSYSIYARIPNQSNKNEKEIKGIQIGKVEVKLSLSSGGMIFT